MLLWKKNQKIAIFGVGKIGKIQYYKYRLFYDIVAFIDNNIKPNSELYGIKIYKPAEFIEIFSEIDYKILVTSDLYWEEMCKQLSESGLDVYDDYIPYWCLDYNEINFYGLSKIVPDEKMKYVLEKMRGEKEVAIIYGNCQAEGIRKYLISNKEFSEKYIVYSTPGIYDLKSVGEIINNENLWRDCSLLITQNIRDENKFGIDFSANSLIHRLECMSRVKYQIVKIMNIKFNGYFPQCINNEIAAMQDIDWEGIKCRDKNIINMVNEDKPMKIDEILKVIEDENLYSIEYMEQYIEDEFKTLKNIEKQCDVKILDYVYDNFKKELLFYSYFHPHVKVIKEYSLRILKYLCIEDMNFEKESSIDEWLNRNMYNHACELIYPSVVKALGLPEDVNKKLYNLNWRIYGSIANMNFRDVVHSYVTICLGKSE